MRAGNLFIAVTVSIGLLLYGIWLWQPERQVRKHQEQLFRSAEKRKWSRVTSLIAPGYSDRWGLDRPRVVDGMRDALRQFFVLEIHRRIESCVVLGRSATVTADVRLEGNGTALADLAQRSLADLTRPFTFEWQRESWQPWDWKLVRVDHPQLRIPTGLEW